MRKKLHKPAAVLLAACMLLPSVTVLAVAATPGTDAGSVLRD